MDRLAVSASRRFGLQPLELWSRSQNRRIVEARREVMAALSGEGWSQAEIADVFGMDRSTVAHHLAVKAERPAREPDAPQRPADADRRVGEKVRTLDDAGAYDLVEYAARRYGISVVDLVSVPHRTVAAVDSARIEVMCALRDEGWSLARIGALFGVSGPTVRKYTMPADPTPTPKRAYTVRRCGRDGCRRLVHARDLCDMHYRRELRAEQEAV